MLPELTILEGMKENVLFFSCYHHGNRVGLTVRQHGRLPVVRGNGRGSRVWAAPDVVLHFVRSFLQPPRLRGAPAQRAPADGGAGACGLGAAPPFFPPPPASAAEPRRRC